MSYVNVGCYVNGKRCTSKKLLRETLAASPGDVFFDTTSAFDTEANIHPDDIATGVNLTVVGPDPYKQRSWYATVSRDAGGKLRVK